MKVTTEDSQYEGGIATVTARGRYESLEIDRQSYLRRARDCALLTIPGLMPPEGHTGSADLYKPYQSVGADGVNNLASKLALVLFPPGNPFFKLELDDFTVEKIAARLSADAMESFRAKSDEALGKMERAVVGNMEENGVRSVLFEVFKHLIVTGNILVHVMEDGRLKAIPMDRFCLKRDGAGNIIDIVVKECMSIKALPPAARKCYLEYEQENPQEKDDKKNIDIFTWVRRDEDGGFTYHQEICNKIIPESKGTNPADKLEWLALRWGHVAGEDYGRSRCDEYIGDLQSLEEIEKAIILWTTQAAKILVMVNEGSMTRKKDIEQAESGAIIDGNAEDVTFLHVEKAQDFQIVNTMAQDKRARLERAFLMASSVQRDAERVTAEEIRAMIGELEQSLGGVYSVLAEELQRPLVVRLMAVMEKKGKLPSLPKDSAPKPKIVTGIQGLGRAGDFQKILTFVRTIADNLGPQAVSQYLNPLDFIKRAAAAIGVDASGIIKSEDQVKQEAQQAMMSQMTQKLGPNVINAMSKNAQAASPSDATAAQAQQPAA
jgi:hypothetical protein